MEKEQTKLNVAVDKLRREEAQYDLRLLHCPLPAARSGLNFDDHGPLLREAHLPPDVEQRRSMWKAAYLAESRLRQ